jgi:hypothetical protein
MGALFQDRLADWTFRNIRLRLRLRHEACPSLNYITLSTPNKQSLNIILNTSTSDEKLGRNLLLWAFCLCKIWFLLDTAKLMRQYIDKMTQFLAPTDSPLHLETVVSNMVAGLSKFKKEFGSL